MCGRWWNWWSIGWIRCSVRLCLIWWFGLFWRVRIFFSGRWGIKCWRFMCGIIGWSLSFFLIRFLFWVFFSRVIICWIGRMLLFWIIFIMVLSWLWVVCWCWIFLVCCRWRCCGWCVSGWSCSFVFVWVIFWLILCSVFLRGNCLLFFVNSLFELLVIFSVYLFKRKSCGNMFFRWWKWVICCRIFGRLSILCFCFFCRKFL